MKETKAIAIVGMGAILPDAPDAAAFWQNIKTKKYSIRDVPQNRWRTDLYYNPDPSAPDKTYTKIGGWVDQFQFEPMKWGIAIPPRVSAVMDEAQQWAIAASRQALVDYGYPQRALQGERVAVILGNAMAGENHYQTALRIHLPEMVDALTKSAAYQSLPAELRGALVEQFSQGFLSNIPGITEDTMPGELANIIAGRVANVFNFSGPNYVTDAACASSLAAMENAVEGLMNHHFDAVLSGGVDRNMGVASFVKFCKIGALSPDGSQPYSDRANGFVMGEGAVIFLLKRLEDAEHDGDKIYAVIRGIGGSSDGKGKGITAPNPIGQQRAIERAWKDAGLSPATAGLIEGHGTSTKVGDVTEVNSLNAIFGGLGLPAGRIALGSAKSNVGHLKSAAGAVGLLKTALALHDKVLPPTANFERPNPNIDFASTPFYVNTVFQPWEVNPGEVRRAGVSSFGFGGANFHLVVEEYRPGMLEGEKKTFSGVELTGASKVQPVLPVAAAVQAAAPVQTAVPYRNMLVLGAPTSAALKQSLETALEQARQGQLPPRRMPDLALVQQPERLVIDFETADELLKRGEKALKAFEAESSATWRALSAQNVYRGSGRPGKVAFLFPGQGSQYVNMLRDLRDVEPVVAETFREADAVMTPILGRSLTSYIFVEGDEASIKQAENDLKDTRITQPAVLTVNVALLRLMAKFGFTPELVIGHSLGEYAALVAAGVLTFAEALEVVSARGREMSKIKVADNGCMAAVSAPITDVERILKTVDGYVVIANINSPVQCVIGGETPAIDKAIAAFQAESLQAVKIPVSHAFHTRIVAPASEPLRGVIAQKNVQAPKLTIVANVTGEHYPTRREEILDLLAQQVASPVQFIRSMQTLYASGARVFVEVGPKRVLNALTADNLKDKEDIAILATNHPRKGGVSSFSEALCGLIAAGVVPQTLNAQPAAAVQPAGQPAAAQTAPAAITDGRLPLTGSVVISGAGLGLPGSACHVFDDGNIARLLRGEMCIEPIATEKRQSVLDRRVTRLVKSDAGAQMVTIDDLDQTIKLAGQRGAFDLVEEFGIPADRADATDITTQLAMGAGIEALRDAGIPLVMTYRQTSKGTYLPKSWALPEALAEETGVIFASAFPGMDRMAEEAKRFYEHQGLLRQVADLRNLRDLLPAGQSEAAAFLEGRIAELESQLSEEDYHFDRRFIFRILSMGHSQFAEHIGARGPNTAVNTACATTTHAVGVAEDWIRQGRCRRVIVIAGDDVTGGDVAAWINAGFLASGASTTESDVRKAVLPFDKRRNGLVMGMGAAALVVEAEDAVRERGMRGICEVLASQFANSAFHGTRLDVQHVADVMSRTVAQAEQRFGLKRAEMARQMVFVSHETYTPARGGSAAAEIAALRQTFGDQANRVVIANTKGYTGHAMGAGIEDVLAVKALEFQTVPAIAHLDGDFQPDPDLGDLNLSHGGSYPVQYALRLGAGFGSQIAMTLTRRLAGAEERIDLPVYTRWLAEVAGYDQAETEVVQRTLRVRNVGQPVRKPKQSTWQFGQGPTAWAAAPQGETRKVEAAVAQPAPQVAQSAPAAAPVQTPSAAPVAVAQSANTEEIKAYVLSVVSEKTGYPPEMLDLELDLEADLGIDTVKQAELFATVRTHYGIPRREDLRLVDYNTLSKVIGFIENGLGSAVPTPAAAPAPVAQTPAPAPAPVPADTAPVQSADSAAIKEYVLSVVSEKTGYPVEMLDLDLDLEADLGIDTVKQAELFATVRTHYGIPRREDLRLVDYNTLTKVIGFVTDALGSGAAAPAAQPAPAAQVPAAAPAAQPVQAASVQTENAAASVASAASAGYEDIKAYVLSAVSEKTGYPTDMLDLDLDLEADLGIDTVKQAELFATVRTHYGIPRREDLRLVDYNTLSKVIAFIESGVAAQASAAQAPAAEAPAAVPAAPAPAAAGGVDVEEIKAYVLAAVSEKTGYPTDMLDLDLDLEADLGIDTVKQAELFATVRTHYGIPRREDLRLVDYNTLAKVIAFIRDGVQAMAAPEPAAPAPAPAPAEVSQPVEAAAEAVAEAVPEPEPAAPAVETVQASPEPAAAEETLPRITRRVPVPALRPRLELCHPTGVELNESSRVVVVGDLGKTGDALARRLRGQKAHVLVLKTTSHEQTLQKIAEWKAEGPIQGIYFLPALDIEPDLDRMTAETWQAALEDRAYLLYKILRLVEGEPFLVCATRLGGLHGYDSEGASAPLGGAVSGLTKAVAQERPNALVKVVDFSPKATTASIAARLIQETLKDPAVTEIGWDGDLRFSITLVDQPLPEAGRETPMPGSVYVVSGGSAGIIAPVLLDLARQAPAKFYLLARSPLPEPDDSDLARLGADRNGLRLEMMRRPSPDGGKVTPAMVETKLAALDRAAATLDVLDRLCRMGSETYYLSCDVTQPESVQAAVEQVRAAEGRVDVLIHAAGMERSRKLESKPEDEFRQIFSVKANGFFNLFKALEAAKCLPRKMAFFTSVAGRFGNTGQTDYSAANDLLCKLASAMRTQHPEIRTFALDWGAWAEVGMASRGHIPELMKRAGIELMSPEAAASTVGEELFGNTRSGEAVLAGAMGALEQQRCADGGLDAQKANAALRAGKPIHTMLSEVTGMDASQHVLLEIELDPQEQPFLKDHALNGIPVLPGVMGIEGFSVAAQHISTVLASEGRRFSIARLEDIQFLAPFKFYRSEPRRITWKAQVLHEAGNLVANVTLESVLARPVRGVERMEHFRGRVYLQPAEMPMEERIVQPPHWNGAYTVQSEDIYKLYFHGPAFQVLEGVQRSGDHILGKLRRGLPSIVSEPDGLITTPVLVELCLQTAGIWEIGLTNTLALPHSIQELVLYNTKVDGVPIFAEVEPDETEDGRICFNARVVDAEGRLYLELKDYQTVPLPYSVEEKLLEPLQGLVKDVNG